MSAPAIAPSVKKAGAAQVIWRQVARAYSTGPPREVVAES